jgi:hypothetical protein
VIDGANWIRLAQARIRWRVFLSTVVNLWLLFDRLSDYRIFKEYPAPCSEQVILQTIYNISGIISDKYFCKQSNVENI